MVAKAMTGTDTLPLPVEVMRARAPMERTVVVLSAKRRSALTSRTEDAGRLDMSKVKWAPQPWQTQTCCHCMLKC